MPCHDLMETTRLYAGNFEQKVCWVTVQKDGAVTTFVFFLLRNIIFTIFGIMRAEL